MLTAFLSYSSKQKGFVELVAKKLGEDKIVYDSINFEGGMKTIDEIMHGLRKSICFVIFLSKESLESEWVKKELKGAHKLHNTGNIKKIIPIIIDKDIKYSDPRIPDWIRDEYNLKYVSSPTKASLKIKQVLREISWISYPKNKEKDQLFLGRTQLIKVFEERIYNFDLNIPVCIIASGLPSIGRRKLLMHCLKNSNKIKENYKPPSIILNSRESIEDFILKVNDLGFSEPISFKNLLTTKLEVKIEMACDLISDIKNANEIIFIIDYGAIVSPQGIISPWFFEILNNIKDIDKILICVISRFRTKKHPIINKDFIFSIEVPELERKERKALFAAFLGIEKIELEKDDFENMSNLFNGFPNQIFYCVDLIKSLGLPELKSNMNYIVEYNSEHVSRFIMKYENNVNGTDFLILLSQFEFISYDFLFRAN